MPQNPSAQPPLLSFDHFIVHWAGDRPDRLALREDASVDHEQIGSVVAAASKLASAVKAFKDKAPPGAIHALSRELDTMMKTLDNMAVNPATYVSRERKHVKLAAVHERAHISNAHRRNSGV